jgi:hypothetical protein
MRVRNVTCCVCVCVGVGVGVGMGEGGVCVCVCVCVCVSGVVCDGGAAWLGSSTQQRRRCTSKRPRVFAPHHHTDTRDAARTPTFGGLKG